MIKKQKLVRIWEKIRNGTSYAFIAFLIKPFPMHGHFLENKLKKFIIVTFAVSSQKMAQMDEKIFRNKYFD